MYKISKDKLSLLFSEISKSAPLYMPILKNGHSDFYPWNEKDEYCESELKTAKSAKDLFFPQSENIISFKKQNGKFIVETNQKSFEKFVLFGVRGCDLKGIEVLDKDHPDVLNITVEVKGIFEIKSGVEKEFVHVDTFKELFPLAKALITTITANAGIKPIIVQNIDIEKQEIYRFDMKGAEAES